MLALAAPVGKFQFFSPPVALFILLVKEFSQTLKENKGFVVLLERGKLLELLLASRLWHKSREMALVPGSLDDMITA